MGLGCVPSAGIDEVEGQSERGVRETATREDTTKVVGDLEAAVAESLANTTKSPSLLATLRRAWGIRHSAPDPAR